MFERLKTKFNGFLWKSNLVGRICKIFFVKECYFNGFQEQRKKIDPRYTNPLYPEFIDRRKNSRLRPVYETKPSSICREHPLYKYMILIGLIVAFFLLCLAILYLSPSMEEVKKVAPKTVIIR